jgi:cytochrome c-type biogenesis protein CcmE
MPSPAKPKFLFGGVLIVGAVAWLAVTGFQESKAYYRTVEEVLAKRETLVGERLKVGGVVEEGSIAWEGEELRFRLRQGEMALPVVYRGESPVPDTFKDGSEAVVEGKVGPGGALEAVKIQAKCASKYEAEYGSGAAAAEPGDPGR